MFINDVSRGTICMKVPSYINGAIVSESGELTESWQNVFVQLFDEMQANLSDEGVVSPSQSSANISIIEPNASPGTLIFDSDTNELKVRLSDGTFHVVQTV